MPTMVRGIIGLMILCSTSLSAFAQCDSLEQLFLADTALRIVASNGIRQAGEFVPSFDFEHQTDSTRFFFKVSEFRKNSRWVFADNWCMDKVWNWSDYLDTDTAEVANTALSALSRSKTISIVAGDTFSVFKRIYWEDRSGDTFAFEKLVNPDAVSMWVELVNASTGARISLLDSAHFSSTTVSTRPCLYAMLPLTARCVFIAPAGFPPTDVYIQVNVSSAGAVNKRWTRWDNIVHAGSNIILNYEGTRNYCTVVDEANQCSPTSTSCTFTVATLSGPKRIRAVLATGSGITNFDLYSSGGQFIATVNVVSGTTTYDVPVNPGLYYVIARTGSSVQCTRNILVY